MSVNGDILASNEPPTKKPRIARTHTFSKQSCALLPYTLKIVVESYFLDTQSLGRLLLFTSKDTTSLGFGHRDGVWVWHRLCCSHYDVNIAAPFLASLPNMSAKGCFRKLALMKQDKPFVLRPLQYSPQDYVLVVSFLTPESNKCLFFKTIAGDKVPSFFEKGGVDVTFDKPLCKAVEHWKANVRLIRKTDMKAVQLAVHSQHSLNVDSTERELLWEDHSGDLGPSMEQQYGRSLLSALFRRAEKPRVRLQPIVHEKDAQVYGFSLSSYFTTGVGRFGLDPVAGQTAIKEEEITFAHILEAVDEWLE